ncbi:MAG: lamin tail domain-containing protein [Candidatus Edwardsbacteria bacterium]|nr:lamin tail domain-containing protein [Candidatus Edwardsbacteria bacterium]
MAGLIAVGATTANPAVVVNEFCYHPHPSNDTGLEWIELYNSDSTEQDLSGWDLYPSRSPHFILPAGIKIGPQSFILVYLRRDGINTGAEIYEGTAGISSNMTNTKGSLALFTNSNKDTIVDFVEYGDDSMTYEATAAAAGIWTRGVFLDTALCGNSLGLISDGSDSNRKADWKEFVGPTPGHTNQPYPVDIAVSSIIVSPESILPEGKFALSVEIVNMGLDTAYLPVIEVFEDRNGDSIRDAAEKLFAFLSWDLLSDKRTALAQISGLAEGQYDLAVSASCSSENYTANNYRNIKLTVGSPVVINEIMYYPNGSLAEWMELYNRSAGPVDIRGWSVEDNLGTPHLITSSSLIMTPRSYLILTAIDNQPLAECLRIKPSGGWPALNDYGDLVRLRDLRSIQEDMVQYLPDWGKGQGKTLERINPLLISNTAASWGLSKDPFGSTPGRRNSIYLENCSFGAEITAGPNPFSPDDDGLEDHTILNYKLPWDEAVVNISIYDRLGRRVRNLLNNYHSAKDGCYAWDGRDEDRRKCPMGIYVILLEAKGTSSNGTIKAKATVALAGKL